MGRPEAVGPRARRAEGHTERLARRAHGLPFCWWYAENAHACSFTRVIVHARLTHVCTRGPPRAEMERLRIARARASQRVLRDFAARRRSGVAAPKLHCVRFNCDQYVAADGTRVGGLFTHTGAQTSDVLKLKPTRAFAPAIRSLVDRLLRLRELAAVSYTHLTLPTICSV